MCHLISTNNSVFSTFRIHQALPHAGGGFYVRDIHEGKTMKDPLESFWWLFWFVCLYAVFISAQSLYYYVVVRIRCETIDTRIHVICMKITILPIQFSGEKLRECGFGQKVRMQRNLGDRHLIISLPLVIMSQIFFFLSLSFFILFYNEFWRFTEKAFTK